MIGYQPFSVVNKEGQVYNSLEALKLVKVVSSRFQTSSSIKYNLFHSLMHQNQVIVKS